MRSVVCVISTLFAAGALALAILRCFPAAGMLAGWALILLVGLLIERWRYKRLAENLPGQEWVATQERFVDPESGRLVTVYYRASTGERRYVAG
jgi:hypothetical protein